MNNIQRKMIILELLENAEEIDAMTVLDVLKEDTTTIAEDFKELLKEWEILRTSPGKFSKKFNIENYLHQPLSQRETKIYNEDFLNSYEPNKDSLLGSEYVKKIEDCHPHVTYTYRESLDIIEQVYIELSYYSNTLSGWELNILDSEILLKFGQSPKWISFSHSQRILNYKNILNHIFENKDTLSLLEIDFKIIHELLSFERLEKLKQWSLREFSINIANTTYNPISISSVLNNQFQIFLEKLKKIESHPEKSFFIFVFLPYLMPFEDANMELSRICMNIPLVQGGYKTLTFKDIDKEEYDFAYRAVFELCDISLLRKIFMKSYNS